MVEVAFRKVLGIKFNLGQQQYFFLETERGKNILLPLHIKSDEYCVRKWRE